MDKSEFQNLVDKYKRELLKIAEKSLNRLKSDVFSVNAQEVQKNPLDIDQGLDMAVEDPQEILPEETYQEFLERNTDTGFLKIQAFGAQMAVPLNNTSVIVKKRFSDTEKVFFEGVTDSSGIIDNIVLPAPPKTLSESPDPTSSPFSVYTFSASHPVYSVEYPSFVQIFSDVKSIQPVRLNLSETVR